MNMSFDKLATTIFDRYGCWTDYMTAEEARMNSDLSDFLGKYPRARFFIHQGKKAYIPLWKESDLLGVAKIDNWSITDDQVLQRVIDLISELGAATISEGFLEKRALEARSNVIDLTSRLRPVSETEPGDPFPSPATNPVPCMILSGSDYSRLIKIADEVHRHSGGFAQLRFRDLDKSKLQTLEDFEELGEMTILVTEPHKLTIDEISLLVEVSDSKDRAELPLIIILAQTLDEVPKALRQAFPNVPTKVHELPDLLNL